VYEADDLLYGNKQEYISLSEEENTMRVIKGICFFAVLALMIMPAACSVAALTSLRLLPDSTFAETQNNWQGQKNHVEEGLDVLVEFCVYDTDNLLKTEEQDLAEALGLSGRYIYAYQIWNYPFDSEDVVAFELLDIEEEEIPESAYKGDTGCHNDSAGGIAPKPEVSTKQGAWIFASGDLTASKHSQFLVFSSDSAPVAGTFDVMKASEQSDLPIPPDNEAPEPGTIALLGVASCLLASRRKDKRPGGQNA